MPEFVTVSEASEILTRSERVMVIGCSGGGKTTLALRIARRHGLEYQSIDRDVRWLPGWQERDRREQRAIIARLVARDRWVMDGSGSSTFDLRVPRADLIVWVRVPRLVALLGLARRVASNYGRVRVAMASGCPEPIPDRAFLSYIWNFETRSAPAITRQIDTYGPAVPVVLLRSRRACERLLEGPPKNPLRDPSLAGL